MNILLIYNVEILNRDFEFVRGSLEIDEEGYISGITDSRRGDLNGKGSLLIPSFTNAHVHLGDTITRDIWIGRSIRELFRPPNGLKHRILKEKSDEEKILAIKTALRELMSSGIGAVCDFREEGRNGVLLFRRAISEFPIDSVVLGRPDGDYSFLEVSDGVGISSPMDVGLDEYSRLVKEAKKRGKMAAVHVGEDPFNQLMALSQYGETEVELALKENVDFLVHLNYATEGDIDLILRRRVPVVFCPRANLSMGLPPPPIDELIDRNLIAIGTDNSMVTSLNIFREMDFIMRHYRLEPKAVLKMVYSGRELLGLEPNYIEEGNRASLLLMRIGENLRYCEDKFSALVGRAGVENVSHLIVGTRVLSLGGDLNKSR
ncbi:MAG TPA: hypothetical protein ENF65_01535 [Euryarchaeota archaeon]|nr:MAG: hypothetical protein DRN46_03155 [Thermococci archaeon]RLF97130.1 MAG: hypothetical protein DRN52_01075 [Thermococci archaeon]HDI10409.1 hypothetical protein [Euryarchaeota archaeon]